MGQRIPMVVDGELKPLWKYPRGQAQQQEGECTVPPVNDPEKEEPHAQRQEGPTTESGELTSPVLRTEVDVLQSLVNEYKARDDQNARLQQRNFRLGRVTAVIVFVYTAVAALQWSETRRANGVAQAALRSTIESSRLDQRAWVGIGPINILNKMTTAEPFKVHATIENNGRSPAVHFFAYSKLAPLRTAVGDVRVPFMEDPDFVRCVGPKPQWSDRLGGAIILPGAHNNSISRSSEIPSGKFIEIVTARDGKMVDLRPKIWTRCRLLPVLLPTSKTGILVSTSLGVSIISTSSARFIERPSAIVIPGRMPSPMAPFWPAKRAITLTNVPSDAPNRRAGARRGFTAPPSSSVQKVLSLFMSFPTLRSILSNNSDNGKVWVHEFCRNGPTRGGTKTGGVRVYREPHRVRRG
jgi:hypothetical protein